jgi:hypothetical protein
VVLSILVMTAAAGTYKNTSKFWSDQLKYNITFEAYAGISWLMQVTNRSINIGMLVRVACSISCTVFMAEQSHSPIKIYHC